MKAMARRRERQAKTRRREKKIMDLYGLSLSAHGPHIGPNSTAQILNFGLSYFPAILPFYYHPTEEGEEKRTSSRRWRRRLRRTAARRRRRRRRSRPASPAAARPFLRLARFLLLPQAHGGVSRVRAAAAGFFLPLESSSASFGV